MLEQLHLSRVYGLAMGGTHLEAGGPSKLTTHARMGSSPVTIHRAKVEHAKMGSMGHRLMVRLQAHGQLYAVDLVTGSLYLDGQCLSSPDLSMGPMVEITPAKACEHLKQAIPYAPKAKGGDE